MYTRHDLPTGRQLEEAWRRVEAAMRSHRRTGHRAAGVARAARSEEQACSLD